MIEVSELRLGNWVYTEGFGFDKVTAIEPDISESANCDAMIISGNNANRVKKIVLTNEMLEKAGFAKSGTYWFKKHVYIYEWGITNISFYNRSIMDNEDPRCTCLEITSLHQLQNYYFALQGEELDIKL